MTAYEPPWDQYQGMVLADIDEYSYDEAKAEWERRGMPGLDFDKAPSPRSNGPYHRPWKQYRPSVLEDIEELGYKEAKAVWKSRGMPGTAFGQITKGRGLRKTPPIATNHNGSSSQGDGDLEWYKGYAKGLEIALQVVVARLGPLSAEDLAEAV